MNLNKTLFLITSLVLLLVGCSSDNNETRLNKEPEAKDLKLIISNDKATAKYTYFDVENDAEGTTIIKWYFADDNNGTNKQLIKETKYKELTLTDDYSGKFIGFELTPAQKDGIKGKVISSHYKQYIKNEKESKDKIALYTVSGSKITLKKKYKVTDDKLKSLQKDTDKHQQIWEQVLKVVPESYRSKINEFLIFAGNFDDSSDLYGTMGYVIPNSEDLSAWRFSIAIDIANQTPFDDPNEGLNGTIVHEFGHIVSLNNEQVNASTQNCSTHELNEGCLREKSFLYKFYNDFWKNISSNKQGSERYDENPNNYVSQYSATNIVEDFAETFRFYSLGSIPSDNSMVKNKKIIELSKHEELQGIRNFIRKRIGKSSLLSRKRTYKLGNFRGCGTQKMMLKQRQNRK